MSTDSSGEESVVYLECCEYDPLYGGEIRLPEKLRLLPEGKDLVLVDGADGGGDLWGEKKKDAYCMEE